MPGKPWLSRKICQYGWTILGQHSTLLCCSKAESCLVTQYVLTFENCKCSWMTVFTVPTERFISFAISWQVMCHYPGSSLPCTECSQEWLLGAENQYSCPCLCLTAAEHRVIMLYLKSSVDIHRFYTIIPKKLHHHTVPHTHHHCCLPSWLKVSGLAHTMYAG